MDAKRYGTARAAWMTVLCLWLGLAGWAVAQDPVPPTPDTPSGDAAVPVVTPSVPATFPPTSIRSGGPLSGPPSASPPSSRPSSSPRTTPPGRSAGMPVISGTSTNLDADEEQDLNFNNAAADVVLKDYSLKTGKTLLWDPKAPKAQITLKSQGPVTMAEYLQAVETVLAMNQIALVPVGERFLKVVPINKARQEDMGIRKEDGVLPEKGQLVSQMIAVRHIDLNEAQKAVNALKHEYATVHLFENVNSLLVTDDAANINRIQEMLGHIDKPSEDKPEYRIIKIYHAKPSEIRAKLLEFVTEAQKDQQKSVVPRQRTSGPPGAMPIVPVAPSRSPLVPPSLRPVRPEVPEAPVVPAGGDVEIVEDTERGLIRGRVQIVADDRTGVLLVIASAANVKILEDVIKVLDVEVQIAREVDVEVIRLEYAQAKTVAGMLNDLIGAASAKDTAVPPGPKPPPGESGKSLPLENQDKVDKVKDLVAADRKSKIGELIKENIKILPDERTNSLIIQASKGDLTLLKEIIKDMDLMLSQVLIEAVILEVTLNDRLESGLQWVQRSMIASEKDGMGGRKPLFAFAGGAGGGGLTPGDATSFTKSFSTGAGLTYYFTQFGLNLDAIFHLEASDTRAKIISSPIIVTHDNKEANIDSVEERYFFKGKRWVGSTTSDGRYEDDVELRKVGIHLKVTPHINTNKFVVMDVSQRIEQALEKGQKIGENEWPIVRTREMTASIAVHNQETIVLGGLVTEGSGESWSGIPLLSKIPLLGMLFRDKSRSGNRTEIVVFLTPYVLDNPSRMTEETARRKRALESKGLWKKGWSASKLAEPETLGTPRAVTPATNAPPREHSALPAPPPPAGDRSAPASEPDEETSAVAAAPAAASPAPARSQPDPADAALREKERALQQRTRELETRDRELRDRERDLASNRRSAEVETREQQLAARELELRRKELALQEQQTEDALRKTREEIARRDRALADRENRLREKEAELARLRQAAELDRQESALAIREAELALEEQRIKAARTERPVRPVAAPAPMAVAKAEPPTVAAPPVSTLPAVAAPKSPDVLARLDPALLRYIRSQEKKWDRQANAVESRIESDRR